ncbi:MAG: periplasmic nitrate reductase, NapE protein [Pseudomonadota bacterium]
MKTAVADESPTQRDTRRRELLGFLFLTVVLAPVLAVAIVGGYGFLVWILQMIYGPPGPPVA